MPRKIRPAVAVAIVWIGLLMVVVPGQARADEILEWNTAGFEISGAGGQNPVLQSRALAMMHLAVHDALNAIEARYQSYFYTGRAEPGAAPEAAIASAARGVLAGVIPSFGTPQQRATAMELLDTTYAAALARIPEGSPKTRGVAVGEAAAAAALTARKDDFATANVAYAAGTAPGQWRPTPNPVPANPPLANPAVAGGNLPAMLPHWGSVTPFTMATPWQFRLPGPPSLASAQYARDYAEVQRLGGKVSRERSDAQTEIAKYWYEPSPQGWSRIARVVGAQRRLDRWTNARLLALVNAVVADGFIAGADTRYLSNFWRPVTAIRAGSTDDNDATVPDPAWESFLNTPAMPDYPSNTAWPGAPPRPCSP